MSRISTAALYALLVLALSGCAPHYTIDTQSPLRMLPNSANTQSFRTDVDACWTAAGTAPSGLELYRDKDRQWWLRCPNQFLVHLGPGPQPDRRALPSGALTPELQRLRDGMYTVQAGDCGENRLCLADPGMKARLAIVRAGRAVQVEGVDYTQAASLYAAIMDGADPATLTPERRLAPVYEAEFRAAIMQNIVARRNVDPNVGLYSRLYGVSQEQVRAEAASRQYARRLRDYRQAYADATTSREVGAFIAAWKDFDPDGLRPKAKVRSKQLRVAEAKAERASLAAERKARQQAARQAAPQPQAARNAAPEAKTIAAPPRAPQQAEGPAVEAASPVQSGRIVVMADVMDPGNYDIALRIDNYSGKPDAHSPGLINNKSTWWRSKTISKGHNGRIGGQYTYDVKFRNVLRDYVCSGTFIPDGSKGTFKIRLHEDCTDAGSRGY